MPTIPAPAAASSIRCDGKQQARTKRTEPASTRRRLLHPLRRLPVVSVSVCQRKRNSLQAGRQAVVQTERLPPGRSAGTGHCERFK